MCGILGSINVPVSSDLLNTIKHRGPDYQAIYCDECGGNKVYLAHTRLSIVDLSDAGNQPIESFDHNYVLVFNGEIYNHLDLRKEITNVQFKGHSDTETLLYYLIEKGENGICNLNGIFAFAFYDKLKGRIIVARDDFGVKPFYYYIKDNQFVFSSEIRPINKLFRSKIDLCSLRVLLSLRYVPSPYTLFENVQKLRPGHYGIIDLNARSVELKIFPFIKKIDSCRNIDFETAVNEYGQKFEAAINRQLMSDVDLGILLSGGIDSALVAGISAKYSQKKLKAFTVGFDSQYNINEIELAHETAEYFGLEHHVVKMDVNDFFSVFSECSRIVEEPLATTSFIPMYYLSKLASQHVKVVLTGQGADEPLGGYQRYQGELLRYKYPAIFFKLVNLFIKLAHIKNETLIRGARSLCIDDDVERFLKVYSLFTDEEVNNLTHHKADTDICYNLISYYYNLLTCNWQKSVDKMMAVDLRMDLADDLLLYTDKITMNFSLECRVPLLDKELILFLEKLPTEYKLKRKHTKIIHRAYAKKILPNAIIDRPKLGFQSPTDIWFKKESGFIKEKLLGGRLVDFIDKNEIINVINQHKIGYNREKQIFLLLSINEWINYNE